MSETDKPSDRTAEGRGGLDIAAQRARLRSAFGGVPKRQPERGRGQALPPGERVSHALHTALLQLVEIEGHDEALSRLRREDASDAHSASISSRFAAAGLVLKSRVSRLDRLGPKDLPCVAELQDGSVIILLSFAGRDLRCASDNALQTISAKRIKGMGYARLYGCAPLETGEGGDKTGWPGFYAAALTYLRENERPLLIQLIAAGVMGYFLMLALPLFTMAVYDRVIPHMALETLWALGIGVMLALALDLALRHVRLQLGDAASLSTASFLQSLLFQKILRTRSQAAPGKTAPIHQGLREVEHLSQLMPQAMVSVVVDAPFFLLLLAFLYSLGGPVAIAPLLGMAVVAAIQLMQFRAASRSNGAVFHASQKITGLVGETVEGLDRIKALNAGPFVSRLWDRFTTDYFAHVHQNRVVGGLAGQSSIIVTQMVTVMVLVIGVYQVRAGEMSMGALIACILLVGRTVSPMAGCVSTLMRLGHMKKTLAWLDEIMAAEEEAAAVSGRATPQADYLFQNVSLSYRGSHRPALAEVGLAITPGERVAVIGRSGSGKSSLLKLMCRLEEPTGGLVRLDGFNILQYAPERVRELASYAAQTPLLFDGTLRDNLVFGLSSPSESVVEEACRITGVARFAAEHPEGYGMKVGPRGEWLSGGERQAVALARSLAGPARLLLLDEPTAAFDTQGEEEFIAAMGAFLKGRTLVVATHRLPVLKLVDRVILLEKGQVVMDGARAEVLERLTRKTA